MDCACVHTCEHEAQMIGAIVVGVNEILSMNLYVFKVKLRLKYVHRQEEQV